MTRSHCRRWIIQSVLLQQQNMALANLFHMLNRESVDFGAKCLDTSLHGLNKVWLALSLQVFQSEIN